MKSIVFVAGNKLLGNITFFTELAHWADSVIESRCPCACLSVYLSVFDIAKHPLPSVLESSCQRMFSSYWPVTPVTPVTPQKKIVDPPNYFLKPFPKPPKKSETNFTVSVLLSPSVKRFSVSRMRDLKKIWCL